MSAGRPPYDPTIYLGSAPYYAVGRPPYSAELAAVVASELDLDGHGRLLDVGCDLACSPSTWCPAGW